MFSSNNHTNNENGVYPLALYLSPFSSHDENNISTPYNHHHHHQHHHLYPNDTLMAAPHHHHFTTPTMAAAAEPDQSLINYMAFSSNNNVMMDVVREQSLVNGGCSEAELLRGMKKPVKKDRHSKIHTAQGLRDRRVRLSIGIARQFFDLQDMLGFDKASKTLEWLLKKSRKAIREVVHEKKLINGDNNEDDNIGDEEGGEEEEEEEEDDDDEEEKSFVSGSSSEYCEDVLYEANKKQEMIIGGYMHREKRKKNELSNISSKGSRSKAMERRAGDKIGSRNTNQPETILEITECQILDPLMRSTSVDNEGEEKLSAAHMMTDSFYEQPIGDQLNRYPGQYLANQESISAARRKIKASAPLLPSYGVMMKDQGSSSSNNINILPQNWDIYDQNPFVDQPFSALSNMNMSTGL